MDSSACIQALTSPPKRGYVDVVKELHERFTNVDEIESQKDKKEFAKLFGEYLRVENILQNYDEFSCLKALQLVDVDNPEALHIFNINLISVNEVIPTLS